MGLNAINIKMKYSQIQRDRPGYAFDARTQWLKIASFIEFTENEIKQEFCKPRNLSTLLHRIQNKTIENHNHDQHAAQSLKIGDIYIYIL